MSAPLPTRLYDPDAPGQQQGSVVLCLGRAYVVVRRLGRGGQAKALLVRGPEGALAVAKVYRPRQVDHPAELKVRLAAAVGARLGTLHPVLVGPIALLDAPHVGTLQPFFPGAPLGEDPRQGPSFCQLLEVACALAGAIEVAPYRCHGDLNRHNILLRYDDAGHLAAVGFVDQEGAAWVGVPREGFGWAAAHSAPEAFDAGRTFEERWPGKSSDAFALALHVLERTGRFFLRTPAYVATGREQGLTLAEDAHRNGNALLKRWTPPDVGRLRDCLPHFPARFLEALAAALDPDPARRPGLGAFRDELRLLLPHMSACSASGCVIGAFAKNLAFCPAHRAPLVPYRATLATSRDAPPPPQPAATSPLIPIRPATHRLVLAEPALELRLEIDSSHTALGRIRLARHVSPEVLSERGVSRVHVFIRGEEDRYTVADAGSSAGTTLDGAPLAPGQRRPLAHGSRLALGRLALSVRGEPRASEPDQDDLDLSWLDESA